MPSPLRGPLPRARKTMTPSSVAPRRPHRGESLLLGQQRKSNTLARELDRTVEVSHVHHDGLKMHPLLQSSVKRRHPAGPRAHTAQRKTTHRRLKFAKLFARVFVVQARACQGRCRRVRYRSEWITASLARAHNICGGVELRPAWWRAKLVTTSIILRCRSRHLLRDRGAICAGGHTTSRP